MRQWWWVLIVVWLIAPSRSVLAEGAGFTVTPELPANQLGGNTGWFNLLVKPGQKQDLTVAVGNQANQAKKLELSLTNAFTQDNGQVGYEPNQDKDESAEVQLTAIGSKPIRIDLAAHQGRKVTFQVTPPANGFAGQVLGAIYVRELTESDAASASGFAVTNRFSMVVAVQLQTSEKLAPPVLHLVSVKAKPESVQATIQNAAPRLFGQLKLQTEVIPAGKTKPVLQQLTTNYAMAPNSAFHYQIAPPKGLEPGEYQLVIAATAGAYKWRFTRAFSLKKPMSAKPGTLSAQKSTDLWPWLWVLAFGVVVGGLIGWWRGRRSRR
ncbi:DUF916 and DUF3324 domain-containing protein [Lacticaseibacillus camelliae]|uniref:Cell surface protein n=1 Tax=Lacticaseibacillus camelliae DSM 22697 = JCM 13995 TaxID=1423730 RepID=A0A0R2F5Q2_9LACO|nr:DUF916 and DUF3324 domain-containing protein [Lacticaseibacillus camelliae]KRN23030.1 cell surface protein [Lacticaseibacillus camelliae DSM 22697 = JCM 13995]